jgi:orotidine-5'-phosphate decarboxylase
VKVDAAERLIVALDQPHDPANPDRLIEVKDALDIVEQLEGLVSFFKVGWPLFLATRGEGIVQDLVNKGKQVFLDLKYGDIPETVKRLVKKVAGTGVDFLTLNSTTEALRAAVEARNSIVGSRLKIFTVTLLTSLNDSDLETMGYKVSAKEQILRIARISREAGCDGIICSAMEAAEVRGLVGEECLIVTPGIRPAGSPKDDHKRFATPRDAILSGANYLVVGRPITRSVDLRGAAARVIDEMQEAFDAM